MTLRVALLLVAWLPVALAAQQPTDTVRLTPVVVTATRVATPADAVPVAVTVLMGDALQARGIRTVADALRLVPGAAVVETGSFGSQTSLFLRGGESDYVKVLVDGVPQNQPGGSFDFANLTTDAVDRIEIVRGPASVLYGSDAVTGVIQIFTRAGQGQARGRLGFGAGRYDSHWSRAEVSGEGGVGKGIVSYGAAVSRFTTDGTYEFNNHYRTGTASARLRLVTPDARSDASLSARYTDGVFHFPTDGGGQLVDSNQHTSARGPSLAFEAGRALSAHVATRLSVGWHREETRFDDDLDGPGDPRFPYHSKDVVQRLVAGARTDVRFSRSAVATVGAEYERQSQSGTSLDTARHNAALYGQLLAGLERTLAVTLGARLDDNQQFGAHATGRAGIGWRVAARTRVRATAGTGFKEPTFFENFASGFVRGNPALHPEQSVTWEAGVDQTSSGGRATARVTYFHERFDDLIQYSAAPVGPDSVNYVNLADARVQGVELDVEAGVGTAWSLEATYTYLDSRDLATRERLQRRPTHAGSVRLGYAPPPSARGSASLSAVFTGERDDLDYSTFPAPRVPLSPHTRVDFAATWALFGGQGALPGVALAARVENLLDARYEDVKNFPARRRTLFFGGDVRFGS